MSDFTYRITGVTKKPPNSDFDQEYLEHIIACLAIAPPLFPCYPVSSILTETQTHHHDTTWGESTGTKGGRCTCIVFTMACTDLLINVMQPG